MLGIFLLRESNLELARADFKDNAYLFRAITLAQHLGMGVVHSKDDQEVCSAMNERKEIAYTVPKLPMTLLRSCGIA